MDFEVLQTLSSTQYRQVFEVSNTINSERCILKMSSKFHILSKGLSSVRQAREEAEILVNRIRYDNFSEDGFVQVHR
ncbi:unnamed protein product [Trichobilharzia szidati]|nr:unnamed protein product [Trichobilharzia szidati]